MLLHAAHHCPRWLVGLCGGSLDGRLHRSQAADMKDLVYLVSRRLTWSRRRRGEVLSRKTRRTILPSPCQAWSSPARTPLAEPIFTLFRSDWISGRKPGTVSLRYQERPPRTNPLREPPQRTRGVLHLLRGNATGAGALKLEASEVLENGEYVLTSSGVQSSVLFRRSIEPVEIRRRSMDIEHVAIASPSPAVCWYWCIAKTISRSGRSMSTTAIIL